MSSSNPEQQHKRPPSVPLSSGHGAVLDDPYGRSLALIDIPAQLKVENPDDAITLLFCRFPGSLGAEERTLRNFLFTVNTTGRMRTALERV